MDGPDAPFSGRRQQFVLGVLATSGRIAALLVVAAGLAWFRISFNREYEFARFETLVRFDAPLPFGHRVLAPGLVRLAIDAGVPLRWALFGLETLSLALLSVGARRLFARRVSERAAAVLGPATLLLLPLPYLLAHRWAIFYPWDTPAMVVLVFGLEALLRERFGRAWLWLIVGALNRETAAVLAPLSVALTLGTPRQRDGLAWAGLMVVGYVVVRQAVGWALPDNPGPSLHFTVEGHYRVTNNLAWLSTPHRGLAFVASLSFVPVLWGLAWRFVPIALRRVHAVAILMVLALLVVANAYEPRAFGEVIVVSWAAIGVGIGRFLDGEAPAHDDRSPVVRWCDRSVGVVLVLGFALFVVALQRFAFLPISQWPMPK